MANSIDNEFIVEGLAQNPVIWMPLWPLSSGKH